MAMAIMRLAVKIQFIVLVESSEVTKVIYLTLHTAKCLDIFLSLTQAQQSKLDH